MTMTMDPGTGEHQGLPARLRELANDPPPTLEHFGLAAQLRASLWGAPSEAPRRVDPTVPGDRGLYVFPGRGLDAGVIDWDGDQRWSVVLDTRTGTVQHDPS